MKMKIYTLGILLFLNSELQSQSSFTLTPSNENIEQLDIRDVLTQSAISSASGESLILCNSYDRKIDNTIGYLVGINTLGEIKTNIKLTKSDGKKWELLNGEIENNVLYFLIQEENGTDQSRLDLLAFDLRLKKFVFSKIITDAPSFSNAKLELEKNTLYIMYDIHGLGGKSATYLKKLDIDGVEIWSREYHGDALDNSSFIDFLVHPNDFIYFTFLQQPTLTNSKSYIYLNQLDSEGNPLKTSKFTFYNSLDIEYNRFKTVPLAYSGENLYFAVQEIYGRDNFGKISITLIDRDLNLKTWRNYSGEFVLEDFKIIPGRFLLSGQRSVNDGKEGYAITAINNLNAIPELMSYYKEGFYNSSIATHSKVGSPDSRTLLLAARPNRAGIKQLAIAIQKDSSATSCNSSFAFTVTKDKLELNEVESIKVFELEESTQSGVMLDIEAGDLVKELNCRSVLVNDTYDDDNLQIFSNNHELKIIGELFAKEGNFSLINVSGQEFNLQVIQKDASKIIFDIKDLNSGIYLIKSSKNQVRKFIKF
ncbi:MAG: T9SS type A sorting domain-containing protein [Saprospiraceae bacterium]|nr:T9SS type A sorting domain-containing protein [Saprospiraceae bacterium]